MFSPRLDILPPAQRALWDDLGQVPPEFALYGGTGIALRLAHRESVDFDLFSTLGFDPDRLAATIPFLHDAEVLDKEENTLTVIVERGLPVQVSFFGLPRLGQVLEPERTSDIGLRVASLLDLAGSKVAVIQKRAEARDYIDIHAILATGWVDVPAALGAAKAMYGRSFNPQISLKALSYFDDGTLPQLPQPVRDRLAAAAKAVDLDRLPQYVPFRSRPEEAR